MCRVEENVPDLSYWSQFDCFLHKTEWNIKRLNFIFALEVSFSIYCSFNSNGYNWYTLKIVFIIYFIVSEINILTKFRSAIYYSFKIYCTSFGKMHGFQINMQWKIIFRIKCKLPLSSWPVRMSISTTTVAWSCTGNFLIRARDCDVWINEAISIAVRDFLKSIIF